MKKLNANARWSAQNIISTMQETIVLGSDQNTNAYYEQNLTYYDRSYKPI